MDQTESVEEYRTAYLQKDLEKLQDVRNENRIEKHETNKYKSRDNSI
jgi:hypothetical protein